MPSNLELFSLESEDIRLSYFTRALNWFFENKKGQPSLPKIRELAADLWATDNFVKPHSTRKD